MSLGKNTNLKVSPLLLLLLLVPLVFLVASQIESQQIRGVKTQSELDFFGIGTRKISHPELNPDESMMILEFGVPNPYSVQRQYGKFDVKIFSISVTLGSIPPFRVVVTDPDEGFQDLGILNAVNLTYVVFIFSDDEIIKVQDSIYFDSESTERSIVKEISWTPTFQGKKDPFSAREISEFSIKYSSVLRTFYYENRTISGAVSLGNIGWNGFTPYAYLRADDEANIVVIWLNQDNVIYSLLGTVGVGVLIVIDRFFSKRKLLNK